MPGPGSYNTVNTSLSQRKDVSKLQASSSFVPTRNKTNRGTNPETDIANSVPVCDFFCFIYFI